MLSSRRFTAHPAPDRDAWRWIEVSLIPVSLASMLVFVFVGIKRSLWLDEANSVVIASHGPLGIVGKLRSENNLPVCYFILSGWTRVFGVSEAALRILSGTFYLIGAAATYLLGRSLFGERKTAFYCAFFYLASTQAIHQAQNVRMYSLLGLLSAVSTLYFVKLFVETRESRRDWIFWIASNTLGALTHMWFFFVLTAQLICCVLWLPRSSLRKAFSGAFIAICVFLLLWGQSLVAQLHNGATLWMPPFGFWFLPDAMLQFYGGYPGAILFYGACVLLLSLGSGGEGFDANRYRILLTLFGTSVALPLIVSIFKPIYWPGRYTIIALPALAVLLGATLSQFAPRPLRVSFCYAVLAITCAAHIAGRERVPESFLAAGYSDKLTSQYIVRHGHPGDALVFTSLSRMAVDYYLRKFHVESSFLESSFPAEIDQHPSWRDASRMLQDRTGVEKEAVRLADRLEAEVKRKENRVWLFYGYDREVGDIVKKVLDSRFALDEVNDLRGPHYSAVLVYRVRKP